jgi:hypothetical protein
MGAKGAPNHPGHYGPMGGLISQRQPGTHAMFVSVRIHQNSWTMLFTTSVGIHQNSRIMLFAAFVGIHQNSWNMLFIASKGKPSIVGFHLQIRIPIYR